MWEAGDFFAEREKHPRMRYQPINQPSPLDIISIVEILARLRRGSGASGKKLKRKWSRITGHIYISRTRKIRSDLTSSSKRGKLTCYGFLRSLRAL
jgi:hypothetical protein